MTMFYPGRRQRHKPHRDVTGEPKSRGQLEAVRGQVWDTQELARDFVVTGFAAPLVAVRRKSDGVTGTLAYQPMPRLYFAFRPQVTEG